MHASTGAVPSLSKGLSAHEAAAALDDQGPCLPLTLAEQDELVGVEVLQTAPMADADDGAIGHAITYELVDCVLHALIERGRGLVEKCQGRPRDQNAAERQPLLLAGRQCPGPVRLHVQPVCEGPKLHGP